MGRISHNFSVVHKCQQGDIFINFSTLVSVLDHIRWDIRHNFNVVHRCQHGGVFLFNFFFFYNFSDARKCQYRWDILITLVLSLSVSIDGIF